MMRMRKIGTFLGLVLVSAGMAGAQAVVLGRVASFRPLPSGIEIQSGPGLLCIRALRDDVLRITASPTSTLPDQGSWAVLPASRASSSGVTPFSDADSVGFDTPLLHVRVRRDPLEIDIQDAQGHVILATSQPIRFSPDDSKGDLGFRVSMHMPLDEHFFGLGEQAGPLDRRGNAYTLWNTDAYRWQGGTNPLYDSIPFFLTDTAGVSYGLYLDNTWRSEFDFGKALRNQFSFRAEGGPLDYYFLYGPAPKKVVEDYAWLTGTAPLPPLWALGYQQSRYSYGTEQELRGIADRLRADRIPSDAVYMDIDYQVKNRPFTLDATKFPNFPAFVDQLKNMHLHLVLITDLHIADLPSGDYAPFHSGEAGNHLLHNPDGSLYVGTVWPGPSVFPDFTQQSTRRWWGSLYKTFYDEGVSGFWNDMNEPSVFNSPTKTIPLDVVGQIEGPGFQIRSATQREIHNIMGMLNSRATYEGLLRLKPNQRPFVLTRASFAGGQRYAATWTGDNSSSWAHLRLSTPMLESLGLCGFYMAGDDIGGYAGSPSMDLLTKWLEVGSFNPIERDHTEKGSNPQEPWVGGAAQEAIRRHYIDQRYRLLPYLYTTAEEASRTGVPIMRPLFLEFPDATADRSPLDLTAGNEFLFGPDLLIAPPPYPDELQSYSVTFPPVLWYDYWTGRPVAKAAPAPSAPLQTVTVQPTVAMLPVYVRGGSILPMQPLVQSTGQTPQGPLELRVYPGPDCHGSIYQDDGATFNYRHGDYLRVDYTCQAAAGRLTLNIGAQEGSYPAWWKSMDIAIYNWPSAQVHVTLNGRALAGSTYDAASRVLHLRIPQSTAAGSLVVTAQR
jgi:alpha-glucosidase